MIRVENRIENGFKLGLVRIGVAITIIKYSFKRSRNPITAFILIKNLIKERIKIHDNAGGYKAIKSCGKYYWSINLPGWPSENFGNFLLNEFQRALFPEKSHLQTIIFGISAKCPLDCIHCYESENLSDKELLDREDLRLIMRRICESGINHIQFSGGEPLCRFQDMISLMNQFGKGQDFWINTSGFGLDKGKAKVMKESGMIGAIISLDHWDENKHNSFRKNQQSYFWVKEAVKNCNENGIIVCLSLCPDKDFVTEENLDNYLYMAKEMGVGFIRIMEPRQAGRYSGKDILLPPDVVTILERFVMERNKSRKYRSFPVIQFPGHYQRKIGCLGSGNRFLYIDPAGNFHSCPFCRKPLGNALLESIDSGIEKARSSGCHMFKQQILC